jgi:2-methylthioadenine synthetase
MHKDNAERPLRVGFISLGCAKNLVDGEIMLGSLLKAGVEITNAAEDADAVIVNTCSFIDTAQEEALMPSSNRRKCEKPITAARHSSFPVACLSASAMNCPNSCRRSMPSWESTR